MHAIARAPASTRATSLMRVKNSMSHLFGMLERRKRKNKNIKNLIVDHFYLTFVKLSLTLILYFHVWIQNEGKFVVWGKYFNQFGIYQPFIYLRTMVMQLKK